MKSQFQNLETFKSKIRLVTSISTIPTLKILQYSPSHKPPPSKYHRYITIKPRRQFISIEQAIQRVHLFIHHRTIAEQSFSTFSTLMKFWSSKRLTTKQYLPMWLKATRSIVQSASRNFIVPVARSGFSNRRIPCLSVEWHRIPTDRVIRCVNSSSFHRRSFARENVNTHTRVNPRFTSIQSLISLEKFANDHRKNRRNESSSPELE